MEVMNGTLHLRHTLYYSPNIYSMKNLMTLLLFVVCVGGISAQIHKGSVMLGGTLNFRNISYVSTILANENTHLNILTVSPTAAYFLSDRFAIGANLGFSYIHSNTGTDGKTFALVPYGRYYFNGSGSARFFGQLNAGFQASGGETLPVFGAGVGADFFLNDDVAIEASLDYKRIENFEAESGTGYIGLNFGVVAFLGKSETTK